MQNAAGETMGVSYSLKDIYSKVHLIRGNTLDKDFFRRKLLEIKPDIIVHMAALPLAALAIEHTEEAFKTIVDSTRISKCMRCVMFSIIFTIRNCTKQITNMWDR